MRRLQWNDARDYEFAGELTAENPHDVEILRAWEQRKIPKAFR
jgi:hypothetical protein